LCATDFLQLTCRFFSKLDSTAAREVMTTVRNVAQAEGIFVLATIHQPSFETMGSLRTCYPFPVGALATADA
jgi:hypothetical protein